MGLFSFLKKKPGGTAIGNLLRVASNKLSGGILGNGANMIPLPSTTNTAPVATINTGQDPAQAPISASSGFVQGILGVLSGDKSIKVDVGAQVPTELPKWLPIAGVGLLGYFLLKGKNNTRRY